MSEHERTFVALSPDPRVDRKQMEKMVEEMMKDGISDLNICKALAGRLVDGLNHGNWPHVHVKK